MLARAMLVAVLALGAAAPAGAAPAWLAPVDLSTAGQHAYAPQVAADAAGNAVAVWYRSDGANYIVQAAARMAGGAWQAPVDLSAAGGDAENPQVAVDPAGNATAVWHRHNGSNNRVQAAVRAAGGAWSAPVDLSTAGQHAIDPRVAVDAAGNAVVVWQRSNGTYVVVQAAVRPPGGVWQAPVDLSAAGGNAEGPQVAVDAAGNAVAVWSRTDGAHYIVQAAVRAAGGAWQAPVDLSAGQDAFEPEVAVDAAGNAVAAWRRSDGMNNRVQAAVRAAGGAWQAPDDLSAPGQDAFEPQVALDAAGNAIAAWRRSNGTHQIVQAAVRPAGGVWQEPVDLSAGGQNASEPRVAVDAAGNAVAVWRGSNGSHDILQAAVRPAGKPWSAPADLSATGKDAYEPEVAFDAAGNAVAAWARFNGPDSIVEAAGLDATGPRLDGVSVPASGTAGEALSFAVSPFDVWSPLGATSWTFGDSRTATGPAVTHTYASAGTYTVGVSAADVLGNATSTTRTVTIGAAPTTPPTMPPVVAPPATPLVTGLRLAPARFRAAASGPAVKAAAVKTGTRVSYTLNVAARVRFTVQRAVRGRSAGRRCATPTRKNRGARRCTRHVTVKGGFVRTRPAGDDRFTFTGRLRGRALAPGRYRLAATPAGGKPARATFRIVR